MVRTALLFQVYALTGSPLHLGGLSLASGLATLVLPLVGGVIADRADRRYVVLVAQTLAAVLGLGIGLLTFGEAIEVWQLYALAFGLAGLAALSSPARTAMIPNLVPPAALLNAFALNSTGWRLSALFGPALAGASIASLGLPITYSLIGVTSLAANVGIALLPAQPARASTVGNPSRRRPKLGAGVWQDLLEGLRFVRRVPIILVLLATDVAAQLFGSYRALLPIFADSLGVGAQGLGLLLSATALGGLLGAAVLLGVRQLPYAGLFVAGATLAYCVALLVLAISPWFPLSLLAVLALGACDAANAIPRNTVIQRLTPDHVRGRVASLQTMLVGGVPPLGEAQSAALATILGAPLALIAGATACALTILTLVIRRPELRQRDL